jgi:hypothetical protein
MKVMPCGFRREAVTVEDCIACRQERRFERCSFDMKQHLATYRPTGPACCICGSPSDGGQFSSEHPAPVCADCYFLGNPAEVTAAAIAWCNTHGGSV